MAGIWLNEDNSHYFFTRKEKSTDPKAIRDFIFQYKDTNVERFLLCANAQKTNFPTDVGDIIYRDLDTANNNDDDRGKNFNNWAIAVKSVIDEGIDIYSIWIDLLREVGISPWVTMRMNDVHNADDPKHLMHSRFYKENLNYRRAMHRDEKWEDRQLNYLIDEVREYHFGILKEYFEKYDFDGIELDWMRFGNHFPVGYEDEGRAVLDEFMKSARKLADEYEQIRRHRIEIGARVPVSPEYAYDMGMDGVGWALSGYVDYLAPSPFWHTSQADIPVERWKRQVAGTGCMIAPCLEICLRQYAFPKCKNEFQFNSIETIRAAAHSFIDRGADAIYTFNYMDMQRFAYDDEGYKKIITETGNVELMKGKRRRHVLTFNDRRPEGAISDEILPYELKKNVFTGFRLHTGNISKKETRLVLLSFKDIDDLGEADIKVYVNSGLCEFIGAYDTGNPKPVDTLYAWMVPQEAHKNGYQVIEIDSGIDEAVLDWIEMLVD
jgi:hypothetical protein